MANKIKFRMSIKEINFDYEGDFEKGQQLQQGITSAVAGLANLQNRAMGIPDANGDRKQIEARVIDPPRGGRRRRRRSNNPDDQASGENQNGDAAASSTDAEGDAGGNGGARRSLGFSPVEQLIVLRKSGYFGEAKRKMGDIVHELHKRGFPSARSNYISGPLADLVRKDVLRREKQENQWVYENGTREEPEA